MRRGLANTWVLAGFAVLGAMLGGGREIQAAPAPVAIGVTGGYRPYGDPFFEYQFTITLNSGFYIHNGDSFTILGPADAGLPGITTDSNSHVVSPYSWGYPTINEVDTTSPYASQVQWSYTGVTDITTAPQVLGTFYILTTYDYGPGQLPLADGTLIDYSWSVDGGTATGSSTFPIVNLSVPEPSSVIMLLAGAVAVPFVVIRERRRRGRQRVG